MGRERVCEALYCRHLTRIESLLCWRMCFVVINGSPTYMAILDVSLDKVKVIKERLTVIKVQVQIALAR